jgi:hypothetical protein
MPDVLRLHDPHLELKLTHHIDREISLGRFDFTPERTLFIAPQASDPAASSLVKDLEAKLGKYIDFENGGLKVLELDFHGRPARFTLVPGWDSSPQNGTRGIGGPSLTLKFTMHF